MNRETIGTGKSVEEAIADAKQRLSITTQEFGFEILELPRKGGFLGLKRFPAQVRVYLEEEPEKVATKKSEAAKMQPSAVKPKETQTPRKPQEKAPPPRPAAQTIPTPNRGKTIDLPKPATQPKPEKNGEVAAELGEKATLAKQYVQDILQEMGLSNAVVKARTTRESVEIQMEGEGLGVVIGRRGETLDALQYLTSLVANRTGGEYTRISIDSGDYRKKRVETLEHLAQKLARNATKTGRMTKLEPMNPYERRIIHAAVSKVEGASSSSIGEEPNRRVVISAKKRPEAAAVPEEEKAFSEQIESVAAMPGKEREERRRTGTSWQNKAGTPRADRRPRSIQDKMVRTIHQSDTPTAETEPIKRICDADIQIPADLAPKEIKVPEATPKKMQEIHTPTQEEREALPLYGRMDIPE